MRKIISLLLCLVCIFSATPAMAYGNDVYVGQEFYFGRYEQDGNTANGPEPICWIVLEMDMSKQTALVISKYGLETMVYNRTTERTAWHDCTARRWLNSQFFYGAFNSAERPYVVDTYVSNTSDTVFLLNKQQVQGYFGSNTLIDATKAAKKHGAYVGSDNGRSPWWVRQDVSSTFGIFVGAHGKIYDGANNKVNVGDNVLRPAMNVRLTAVNGIPNIPLVEDPGVIGMTNDPIYTRSGASTQYDELGGYYEKGGYPVWVISREVDNMGLWWYQIEFMYGGKMVRVYTGHWRVEVANELSIPVNGPAQGYGSVTENSLAYYGPGTEYKAHQRRINAGTSGEIFSVEDGFVCFEERDANGKNPRRYWLPEDCVVWTQC